MFIQSQGLPWRPAAIPGVDGKTLSRDETSGAVTQLLRYPPGWRRTEREHWTVDEEFLVLDGYTTRRPSTRVQRMSRALE
jgi:hypothetical protein